MHFAPVSSTPVPPSLELPLELPSLELLASVVPELSAELLDPGSVSLVSVVPGSVVVPDVLGDVVESVVLVGLVVDGSSVVGFVAVCVASVLPLVPPVSSCGTPSSLHASGTRSDSAMTHDETNLQRMRRSCPRHAYARKPDALIEAAARGRS
jgi:hypothetical protein